MEKRRRTDGLEFYYSERWRRLKRETLKRDKYHCRYCGRRATSADHIVTRRAGGPDTLENLAATCQICNEIAGGFVFTDFEAKKTYIQNNMDLDGNPIVIESDWEFNFDTTNVTNLPF